MALTDKRLMERFDLNLPAYVTLGKEESDKKTFEFETLDVCAGGAFFKTDKEFPVGAEVDVDLVLPLDELKKIPGNKVLVKVSGSVIRKDSNGLAVSFDKKYEIVPISK